MPNIVFFCILSAEEVNVNKVSDSDVSLRRCLGRIIENEDVKEVDFEIIEVSPVEYNEIVKKMYERIEYSRKLREDSDKSAGV